MKLTAGTVALLVLAWWVLKPKKASPQWEANWNQPTSDTTTVDGTPYYVAAP